MIRKFAYVLLFTAATLFGQSAHAQDRQDPGPNEIIVNGRVVSTLQQAFELVTTGGIIRIGPGTYRMAGTLKDRDRVSIFGSPGTIFDGVAAGGKATFVLASNDITMEDIICRNVKVKDKNGACVRLEGTNLTLRRVVFENSENGILAGGKAGNVLIEDSVFRANGAIGRSHGMYINGGRLTVRRTQVLASRDQGHGIKSRAERTIIEDSVIASLDGDDSRLIDIPNGGVVAIRNNLLVEGANTVNWQLFSYGVEGNHKEVNVMRIENNLIITDREGGSELIMIDKDIARPVISNNMLVGYFKGNWGENNFLFEDRDELNLPPSGELPAWKPLEGN